MDVSGFGVVVECESSLTVYLLYVASVVLPARCTPVAHWCIKADASHQ